MPYFHERKEATTHVNNNHRSNAHPASQARSMQDAAAPFPGAWSSPSEDLFVYLHITHLTEAQEFRRKGYNTKMPEVDPVLVEQLREAIADARESEAAPAAWAGVSDASWSRVQLDTLDNFTRRLSDDTLRRWVNHELGVIHGDKKYALTNRAAAHWLAERLESTLRTLKNVVDVLFPAGDDAVILDSEIAQLIRALLSEAEKDRKIASALSGTMPSFFSELAEYFATLGAQLSLAPGQDHCRLFTTDPESVRHLRDAVTNASLNHGISTEGPFDAPWTREKLKEIEGFADSLSEQNVQRWVSHEKAIKKEDIYRSLIMPLNSVVQTLTDVTDELLSPGRMQNFSSFGVLLKIVKDQAEKTWKLAGKQQGSSADFFREVSLFLKKLHKEMNDVSVIQSFSDLDWLDKKGSQVAILLTRGRTLTASLYGMLLDLVPPLNPSLASELLAAKSIVRSILWSWQQTAIKTRNASHALYSKTDALHAIKDRVLPVSALHGEENKHDYRAAKFQQRTPEGAVPSSLGDKMVVLNLLLNSDITRARNLLKRMGETKEGITNKLTHQRYDVLKIAHEHLSCAAPFLKILNILLHSVATELAAAGSALNKAILAVDNCEPNYRQAKASSEEALLLATRTEKRLSAAAASMTGRSLDDNARGARLARHWAQVSLENTPQDWVPPDAAQVLALLKKYHLTDDVLSVGDPKGYLFATRLAAEFENARNGELRTPMNPEQYTALEKGLVEYLVKWGQQRTSSGSARLAITLSFDALGLLIGLSALTGLTLRTVKDVITIPYSVHQLKKFIMPGEDIPFRAINTLLDKKLKQLGFKLAMTPLPGALKFIAGSAITAGVGLYNRELKEKTFEAVYERVTEGKASKQIKMASAGRMLTDSVLSGATTAGFKGAYSLLGASMNGPGNSNNSLAGAYAERLPVGKEESGHGILAPSGTERQMMITESQDGSAGQPFPTEAETWRESGEREEARAGSRVKRSTEVQNTRTARATGQRLRADQVNFNTHEAWSTFTDDKKKSTYLYGIKEVLRQIENDQSFPQSIRDNAWLARIGAPLVVPVDIGGFELNNTFLLCDAPGSKSGVLVLLDSAPPYYYVSRGEELRDSIRVAFPHNENQCKAKTDLFILLNDFGGSWEDNCDDAKGYLGGLRRGFYDFDDYFNRNNPSAVDIASLSSNLATTIDRNYKLKGKAPENRQLIMMATLGSQIPDPQITVTPQQYELKITWENLTPAGYLRSFAQPFSTLSGQTQLLVSSIAGQTVQQTEINADKAEYIGSWVDVSVGAVTVLTPQGIVLSAAQAIADIAADVAEGSEPDPLAVAGLVVGSVPGGRIAAKIGKFSRVGGVSVKYVLMIADKAVDLATVGQSIKYACETGEPLAIYQSLLASGMSVKHSYDMARHIVEQIKLSKPLEASATLEALEEIESKSLAYTVESNAPVRTFKIGNTALQGKIEAGEIRISRDNGISWERGSSLHLLVYRLQNAGGRRQLPEADSSAQINAQDADLPAEAGAGEPQQMVKAFGEDLDFPLIDNEPSETEKALQRNLFSAGPHANKLKIFRDDPSLFCYEAMIETFKVLKAQGEKPRVVGILAYKNPGDTGPKNHFAVRITKDGADFIVDPTIRQFDPDLPDSATVLPYAEWKRLMEEKVGTGADHFILLKEFDGPLPAKRIVSDLQSSMGKFYQSAMIEESKVNILNVNNKFKNSIILELQSRKKSLRKSETSSENPEDILKDIVILRKLKSRFNLLSPEEIRPSEKVGKKVKEIPSRYLVNQSDIAAIQAGKNSRDIIRTVYGRRYLKIRKNAWLKVEQGENENFMRVVHGGKEEIIIRFNETKNKWQISSSEKMAAEMTVHLEAGTSTFTPPATVASRPFGEDKITQDDPAHSTVERPLQLPFGQATIHHITLNRVIKYFIEKLHRGQKIQVFDANKREYINSDDFTLSCDDFVSKIVSDKFSADALDESVKDMKKRLAELTNVLSQYSGSDKAEISANFSIVSQALNDIRSNNIREDSVPDRNVTLEDSISNISSDVIPDIRNYALIKKGGTTGAINSPYALLNVQYNFFNSDISIRFITAHPYVIVNKYPNFRDYLIKQGLVSADKLADYNIKNVARFFAYKALHSEVEYYESFPDVRVKSFSFRGVNPITQQMGYILEEIAQFFSRRKYSED